MLKKKINLTLFTNNLRGITSLKYLIKKKVEINNIIISKKNLNFKVINFLENKKINYTLINNLKNQKVLKILRKTHLGLICGFPHLFKKHHLKLVSYGLINLHGGSLPKYRGGSPLNWQIINNEKYFGISVIKIDKDIDTGSIIYEKKFKLLNRYTIEDLHRIANNSFPKLLYKSISKIISGKKLKKQNRKQSNYYKQRKPQDSFINPRLITFKKLNLLIRALSKSYPNPYIIYKDEKIILNKIKSTNLNLNFYNDDILIKSGKFFLKLKDQNIQIIKTNVNFAKINKLYKLTIK
jgi:methionyl-tRNA formyltransferase